MPLGVRNKGDFHDRQLVRSPAEQVRQDVSHSRDKKWQRTLAGVGILFVYVYIC